MSTDNERSKNSLLIKMDYKLEPNIFTIPVEEMPSKGFSVSFKEPLFKERREVSRKFPGGRVGYSMEEMLLANCITAFNNQPFGPGPRDPMQSLQNIPHVDAQYLLTVFLGMFTLDNEMAESAKNLGTDMKLSLSQTHTIPRECMPLQLFSVTFKTPTLGDRIAVDRKYPGSDSNCGYSLEELLFAHCLIDVNGQGSSSKDINALDEWYHLDAQYAMAVFINAVTIDSQDTQKAKSLGKSLRSHFGDSGSKALDKKNKDTATKV